MYDRTFISMNSNDLCKRKCGEWSWGQISWDQNSTFSGDRIINHEVQIPNNWFNLLIDAVFMKSKLPNNAF